MGAPFSGKSPLSPPAEQTPTGTRHLRHRDSSDYSEVRWKSVGRLRRYIELIKQNPRNGTRHIDLCPTAIPCRRKRTPFEASHFRARLITRASTPARSTPNLSNFDVSMTHDILCLRTRSDHRIVPHKQIAKVYKRDQSESKGSAMDRIMKNPKWLCANAYIPLTGHDADDDDTWQVSHRGRHTNRACRKKISDSDSPRIGIEEPQEPRGTSTRCNKESGSQ